MLNVSNFSERLADLIFEAGTNATTLNVELGHGNATISRYLTGQCLPTVAAAVQLADYFHCTVDYLLGLVEENNAHTFKPCPPFGQSLAFLCNYYQISRYRLQKMTNIPESVMRYWVQNKTQPSLVSVVRIAEALHCAVDFVLGREC